MARDIPLHLRIVVDGPKQLGLFAAARVFASYDQWEDYKAGMYSGRLSESFVESSMHVLAHIERCRPAMGRVIREWPVAAAVNLTNMSANRRAWIGQAACCLSVGASADETKRAWWQLTERERERANGVADETIAAWHTTRT